MILQQVQEKVNKVIEINCFNPDNAIKQLDSIAKAKAPYAYQVVAVPDRFLNDLDTIVVKGGRSVLNIPRKQGKQSDCTCTNLYEGIMYEVYERSLPRDYTVHILETIGQQGQSTHR